MIFMAMNMFAGPQLKATIFLAVIGLLFLAAVVAFLLSIRAQKVYDTEVLPNLPGMDDEDETLLPEENVSGSAFHLEDDADLHSQGDKEAVDLFREMRAASQTPEKKKRSGLFGKKS